MLTVVMPETALEIILSNIKTTALTETVSLYDACGKVAARDIISGEDLPSFNRSVVDGLAVRAADTYGCSEAVPSMLKYSGKILMGQSVEAVLPPGCCMEIPTGGMLPKGADAAVMIEHTENIGDGFRYVMKPCAVFENIARRGEDCKSGRVIIPHGTMLGSNNIAVLAALGNTHIESVKPPKLGIISTGDEIVHFSRTPRGAEVRDINTIALYSCAKSCGCEAKAYPIAPDNEKVLESTVKNAVKECDFVLISGGSSVGEKDILKRVLSDIGKVLFHGIAIKPGKPTLFAAIDSIPVFGLPGHPAAAFFAFSLFVKPAIRKFLGSRHDDLRIEAAASQNIPSNHGRQETVAVTLKNNLAIPLPAKSGIVSALSSADGYIIIGRDDEGVLKGERVTVNLF